LTGQVGDVDPEAPQLRRERRPSCADGRRVASDRRADSRSSLLLRSSAIRDRIFGGMIDHTLVGRDALMMTPRFD
jgi:hypothetical protein